MTIDYTPSPEYLEAAARLRATGAAYWRERFALKDAQPKATNALRMPKAEPVRVTAANPLERLSEKSGKSSLTIKQAEAKRREASASRREESRSFVTCVDCGNPTGRRGTAKRCAECGVKAKKQQTAASRHRLHRDRHGLTGADAAAAKYDVPVICSEFKRRLAETQSSQRQAARAMEMSHDALNHILLGYAKPLLRTVEKLCAWLGVAPEQFLRQKEAA